MSSLVYNPATLRRLHDLANHPPQSLLLTGQVGVGLLTAARHIAKKHGNPHVIRPTDAKGTVDYAQGSIRIDQIRALRRSTRGKATSRRFVIIDDADRLTAAAQNAFLKLLEEPPHALYIILTSHRSHGLLATIRSRVQTVRILPPHSAQMQDQLSHLGIVDEKQRRQLQFIAPQQPATVARLVDDSASFQATTEMMTDARRFMTGDHYQKLIIIHHYLKDRGPALAFLECVCTMGWRMIQQRSSDELLATLQAVDGAYEAIAAGGNLRLQLLACAIL